MIVRKNDSRDNRIGISVSKKVGNSVVRHHITRVVREIFRLHWDEIRGGHDIVIVARAAAKESGYRSMESAVMHLLKLHHLSEDDLR
jgi:ribonuclease P protein component